MILRDPLSRSNEANPRTHRRRGRFGPLRRALKSGWLPALLLCGGVAGWLGAGPAGGDAVAAGSRRAETRRRIAVDGAREAESPARFWRTQLGRLSLRPPGDERCDALAALADAVEECDVPLVLRILTPDELRSPFGTRLFDRWIQTQPAGATLWAWERAERNAREDLLRLAAARWAEEDEAAAVAWVEALPPGHESRNFACAVVGGSVLESHPLIALRLAFELPEESSSRALLARAAVAQWAKADPPAVAAWVQLLPPDVLRDSLVGGVAEAWATGDAPAALRFACESLPAGDAQDEIVTSIVQRAGPTAGALPAIMSDEELRATDLPVVVALWTARNPAAAGAWLEALPDGPQRDRGIAAHALVLAGRETPAALDWARRIADPALRTRSVDRVRGLLR